MKIARSLVRHSTILFLAVLAGQAFAQDWAVAYDKAVDAAKAGQWAQARALFKDAIAIRPSDQSSPSTLPGPITEPRVWKSGSPYSPNFGAAYAAYRWANTTQNEGEKQSLITTAIAELEGLVTNGQRSPEAIKLLSKLYRSTEQEEALQALSGNKNPANWKVDTSFLASEDLAGQSEMAPGGAMIIPGAEVSTGESGNVIIKVQAGREHDVFAAVSDSPVVYDDTKFALIVGNSESAIAGAGVPFAASDADVLKEALTFNAGYNPKNVVVLQNASAADILAAAKALAEKTDSDSAIFFYFSGVGANIDGKDYYAGPQTQFATDTSTMLAKSDLQKTLLSKGAQVFMFNQVNRPITDGNYFGKESSQIGRISEAQATMPGEMVYSLVTDGKPVGIYTQSIANVLARFRSNSVPVTEFCWQVFYDVRGGTPGGAGGGSQQTPTLPIISNMDKQARF